MKTSCSKLWFISFVLVLTVSWGVTLYAQKPDRVAQLIAEGNDYSEKQFDNQKALDKYLQADSLSPNNDEILWRISRSYVDIGEHLPADNDEGKEKQLET